MTINWSKILKRTLYVVCSFLALLFLVQLGLYSYFINNKAHFKKQLTQLFSAEINGNINFKDIDITFYENFPMTTIGLDSLSVTDSLYQNHNIKAIELNKVFLKVDIRSLLKGSIQVKKLTLANGIIHFFTDSSNYSNLCIFPKSKEPQNRSLQIKNLSIRNVQVIIEDELKKKEFSLLVNKLSSTVQHKDETLVIAANLKSKILGLYFNKEKGGFLVDKRVKGSFKCQVNSKKKTMRISKLPFDIEGEEVFVAGEFRKEKKNFRFQLEFSSPNGSYGKLRSCLPKFHQKKLNKVEIKNRLNAKALVRGKFNYPDTPSVKINIVAQDNTIKSKAGTLRNANFEFEFYNFLDSTKGHTDENSYVTFRNLSANWKNIPFESRKLQITNLTKPWLKVDVKSNFSTEQLNTFTEGTMSFKKGRAKADVVYSGPLLDGDLRERKLNGTLEFNGADIEYTPNQMSFTNCMAHIRFKGDDLYFDKVHIERKQDEISLTGEAKSFLNFYFNDPRKITIDWKVRAKQLHLENYLNFINRSKSSSRMNATSKLTNVSRKLASFTDQSTMHLKLDLDNITYKKFRSSGIYASVSLLENAIQIRDARLKFKRGLIKASGDIEIENKTKDFKLQAELKNVSIPSLLHAFNNFGQPTFNEKNISGTINLNTNIQGKLNKDASLKEKSLVGNLHIDVQNGSLNNFEPLEKVEKYFLKTRDLSNLDIRKLSLNISMKNSFIIMPLTEVNTSALNIFMLGTYGVKSGTDIKMLIPLRNPKKDEIKEEDGIVIDKKKGIKIYLHAQDDENGKVKLSWLKRNERPNFNK